MPYSQLFEHKGPLLFLINAIGYFFFNTKFGVFIIQIINFVVVELFLYRLFRMAKINVAYSIAFTVICILYILLNYAGGKFCEEYCAIFLIISTTIQYK